jgi:hypothetical protein
LQMLARAEYKMTIIHKSMNFHIKK